LYTSYPVLVLYVTGLDDDDDIDDDDDDDDDDRIAAEDWRMHFVE
jgi:hypothetical protein